MIDTTTGVQVDYGANQKVTVYSDHADANTKYIVPTPTIATNATSGLPEFSLVEYTKATGSSGACVFQVDLLPIPAAEEAVKAKYPGMTLGQFDWQSAQAWFTFVVQGATLQTTAQPSLYGSNRASFIVDLPTKEAYQAFADAFGTGSGGGTFELSYDVNVLTQLPDASVNVTFNSDIAYDYSKTVNVTKNVWGSVTSRSVTIREMLSQSQAGKVTVDASAVTGPAREKLEQMLRSWGNATLEDDVNAAVANAMRLIGANNADQFSVSSVASFNNTYVSKQVVPWQITTTTQVAPFPPAQWAQLHSTIDERDLSVAFTVENLTANGVQSVELEVTYPTKTTDNTNEFVPTGSGSWVFTAPGNLVGGTYSPEFKYQYTVTFDAASNAQPYVSPTLTSSATEIVLNAQDLAVVSVVFDGTNVWNDAGKASLGTRKVTQIQGDFFFQNDADGQSLHQTFTLSDTTQTATVASPTKLPYTNDYTYRLLYLLDDNTQFVVGPQMGNNHKVMVNSPMTAHSLNIMPLKPSSGDGYELVQVNATFNDPENKISKTHQWAVQANQTPVAWDFAGPANKDRYFIEYSGMYVLNGTQAQIQQAVTANLDILVSSTQGTFGVQFDPSQIEWAAKKITRVNLEVWVVDPTTRAKGTLRHYPFLPVGGTTPFPYSFMYDLTKTPEFTWQAKYWHEGDTDGTSTAAKAESGVGIVTLPGDQT